MHLRWRSFRTRSQSSASRRADPALGDRVRSGTPRWRPADFRAFDREHGIEGGCGLGVAIADHEARPQASSVSSQVKLRACFVTQLDRTLGAGGEEDPAAPQVDEEEHVEPLQDDGVHREEVGGRTRQSACHQRTHGVRGRGPGGAAPTAPHTLSLPRRLAALG